MASYNRRMPIYEYECKKCKAHVEAFQKVNDKPLTKCLKCGEVKVNRSYANIIASHAWNERSSGAKQERSNCEDGVTIACG